MAGGGGQFTRKYSDAERAEMVRLVKEEGLSRRKAAERAGVSVPTIQSVVSAHERAEQQAATEQRQETEGLSEVAADQVRRVQRLVERHLLRIEERVQRVDDRIGGKSSAKDIDAAELDKAVTIVGKSAKMVKEWEGRTQKPEGEPKSRVTELAEGLPDE